MTPIREALVLPVLFLTVTLLGGLRVDARVLLLAPPLVAVVLGVLLAGALTRAAVLVPASFVHSDRTLLENASGAVVLLSLLAASAQIFNLAIPDTGLLHLLFTAFFFLQILTTIAGASGPRQLLRSVGVLLMGAFVMRWVILETLYAADGGTAKRMLTLLLEGVSLGAIDYQPHAPVTGYVAMLSIALYLIGLFLLPAGSRRQPAIAIVQHREGHLVLLVVVAGITAGACSRSADETPAPARGARASASDGGTAADNQRLARLHATAPATIAVSAGRRNLTAGRRVITAGPIPARRTGRRPGRAWARA